MVQIAKVSELKIKTTDKKIHNFQVLKTGSMKITYIKHGIWHLGARKEQKGGCLSILGALARHLLVSKAGVVGGEVLKGLGKKIWWGRKRRSRRRRQRVKMFSYA